MAEAEYRSSMKKKNVLFFETYSLIQILFLFRWIRRADVIYFHRLINPSVMARKFHNRVKDWLMRLIAGINRTAEIREVPESLLLAQNWETNKEAISVMDEFTEEVLKQGIFKTVLNLVSGDTHLIKFYQHRFVNDISSRLLFFRVARELRTHESAQNAFWLIPAMNWNVPFEKGVFGQQGIRPYLPSGVRQANQFRAFFLKIFLMGAFLFTPLLYVIPRLRKISWKSRPKKTYDVLVPVAYGIFEGEAMRRGTKRYFDDAYLYNPSLKVGEILHLLSKWRFSAQEEGRFKKAMEKKGIPYADAREFRMPLSFIKRILALEATLFFNAFKEGFYIFGGNPYYLILVSIFAVLALLEKNLELENIDYKVEWILDDYNPKHILSTILAHQRGKKTVGIQHHANAYDCPAMSFVYCDRYLVFGDLWVKSFLPHWNHSRLEKTGRQNIDWIIDLCRDKGKNDNIRERLIQLYGKRKYRVVFLLPNGQGLNRREKWDEVYQAILQIKNLNLDLHLFLRFRGAEDLELYDHLRRFEGLARLDSRLILDHTNFTTQELMSVSNLVIANSSSFAVWEAIAGGIPVFTFDFIGSSKYYFDPRRYGKDLILNNASELVRVFQGLETGFKGFDCNWQALKRDCNYHEDGKNLERIQKVVLDTLSEFKQVPLVRGENLKQYETSLVHA